MQQHPAPTVPTPSGPHCVVEFPFEAAGPGELSLSKGEVVELLERVGDNWFKGRLAGIEGIFPTNFVNVVVDLPPGGGAGGGVDTPTLGPNMAAAVADFDGMEGELSFKVRPDKCHSPHTVHAVKTCCNVGIMLVSTTAISNSFSQFAAIVMYAVEPV